MPLAGRHVVLGVSGGIACYKSCTLVRRLLEDGATVEVVMTAGAAEFVRPLTFEALTGRKVLASLWERDHALAHIGLAKTPDLIILAPATLCWARCNSSRAFSRRSRNVCPDSLCLCRNRCTKTSADGGRMNMLTDRGRGN